MSKTKSDSRPGRKKPYTTSGRWDNVTIFYKVRRIDPSAGRKCNHQLATFHSEAPDSTVDCGEPAVVESSEWMWCICRKHYEEYCGHMETVAPFPALEEMPTSVLCKVPFHGCPEEVVFEEKKSSPDPLTKDLNHV